METLGSNFEYRQIPSMNRTSFYSKYREIPSATIWECIRYRWIPLATLNTQIIFFLNIFSDGHEAATKDGRLQTICSRASIAFIPTNPVKIQIYRQLLLATQIPSVPRCLDCQHQIPPNTIWELALSAKNVL